MKIGYARVSTQDQSLDRQRDQLLQDGCERIYEEKVSGAKSDRPELERLLDVLREGDVVVVAELSRLSRSVRDLFDIDRPALRLCGRVCEGPDKVPGKAFWRCLDASGCLSALCPVPLHDHAVRAKRTDYKEDSRHLRLECIRAERHRDRTDHDFFPGLLYDAEGPFEKH